MKFKAFTLAEVLITLGIIGVVASVTLPSLSVDVEKRKIAPALAKAINTLENANKLALVEYEVRSLDEITDKNGVAANNATRYIETVINKYVVMSKQTYNKRDYKDEGTNNATFNPGTHSYTTKDGISYFTWTGDNNNIMSATAGDLCPNAEFLSCRYYNIIVDINGPLKGANSLGKDVFYLMIDTKGMVFPAGSMSYRKNNSSNLWTATCENNKKPTIPGTCSASIVEQGWQVLYKL